MSLLQERGVGGDSKGEDESGNINLERKMESSSPMIPASMEQEKNESNTSDNLGEIEEEEDEHKRIHGLPNIQIDSRKYDVLVLESSRYDDTLIALGLSSIVFYERIQNLPQKERETDLDFSFPSVIEDLLGDTKKPQFKTFSHYKNVILFKCVEGKARYNFHFGSGDGEFWEESWSEYLSSYNNVEKQSLSVYILYTSDTPPEGIRARLVRENTGIRGLADGSIHTFSIQVPPVHSGGKSITSVFSKVWGYIKSDPVVESHDCVDIWLDGEMVIFKTAEKTLKKFGKIHVKRCGEFGDGFFKFFVKLFKTTFYRDYERFYIFRWISADKLLKHRLVELFLDGIKINDNNLVVFFPNTIDKGVLLTKTHLITICREDGKISYGEIQLSLEHIEEVKVVRIVGDLASRIEIYHDQQPPIKHIWQGRRTFEELMKFKESISKEIRRIGEK